MSLNAPVARLAYPLNEVAALLGGVSQRTLYNHIGAGALKTIKVGGRRLVTREDLAAFIDAAKAAA